MNSKTLIIIFGLNLGLGSSLSACDKSADSSDEAKTEASADAEAEAEAPEPEPEPEPFADADEATKASAKDLVKKRDGDMYPDELLVKDNAKPFLYLAATQTDTDAVVAALDAIEQTWTSTEDDEYEPVDADYLAVVRKHLDSEDAMILEAAMKAASRAMRSDALDDATLDALMSILTSHDSVGARYLAVNTIGSLPHEHPRLGALLLEGMAGGQADVVLSKSIDRVPFVADKMTDRAKVMARVVELTRHENPGVRGNAAKTLADLALDDEHAQVRSTLEPMLEDEHPFVRAAALGGFGRMRDPAAIEAIVTKLDDQEKGTYALKGWKTLAGRDGRMHHQGGAWFRVDRMALQALQDCTWRMKDKAFKPDKIEFKTQDEDVAKAVKQAKAWYKKNRKDVKTG